MESKPQLPPEERQPGGLYIVQRASLMAAIVLLGNVLSYLPVYIQHPDWQPVLLNIIITAVATGTSFLAYWAFRQHKFRLGYLSVGTVLLLVPLSSSLTNRSLFPLAIATLAVLLLSLAAWPNRWGRWLSTTVAYLVVGLGIIFLRLLPTLTPQQADALAFSDTLATVLIGLFLLYEIVRLLPNISIRSRLLVTSIGAMFVPMVLIAVLSAYFALSGGRQQLFNQLTSVAQLKKNQIGLWEDNLQNLLQALVSDPQAALRYQYLLQSSSQAQQATAFLQVEQQFQQVLAATPYFEELFLLDTNGKVIYSTDQSRQGQLLSNTTFFRLGLVKGNIQPRTYDPNTRRAEIIASRPVLGTEGETLGVIAGRVNLQVLDDIMQERSGLKESGETYLVGLNHALLTSTRQPDMPIGSTYIDTQAVHQAIQNRNSGTGQYPNYAGQEVLGVYTWVPELQAVLLAEEQMSDAFGEVYIALLVLAGLALAGSVLAGVVTFYITRGISTPLNELAQTAGRITAGDLHVEVPVRSQDEIGTLATAFNAMTSRLRSLIGTLEQRVAERTAEIEARSQRLEAVAQIGSTIASIREMDVLLERITHLISQRLGYYHVGIFLLDEKGEYAVLRAANSAGGQRMLARQHRLRVGETGIVGYVTANRQPRVALDVGEDATYFNNPDLPATRSEAALPLIAGQILLGALDVQSTEPNAFSDEDVNILQLLADQLAIAIENSRLFLQTQQALEEAQRAYGKLSQQAWLRMLEEGLLSGGYRSGREGLEALSAAASLPSTARQAIQSNTLVHQVEGDEQRVAVPLRIRDTTIGVLETYKPRQAGRWTPEELETLQNIVNELSEALEGARLYAETNLRAENERRLAEIASQVRASLDTEDILQTAVRHIQQAFALAEVEIRMEAPDEE